MRRKYFDYSHIPGHVFQKVAGILDAQCHIGVYPQKPSGHLVSVKIRRPDPDEPRFIHEHFGGYLTTQTKGDQVWYWCNVQGPRGLALLRGLQEYLVTRKEQCQMVLRFKMDIEGNKKRRLSPETKAQRAQDIAAINLHNRKFWTNSPGPGESE